MELRELKERQGSGWLGKDLGDSVNCAARFFCGPINVNCPYLIPVGALRDGKGLAQRLADEQSPYMC